LHGSLQQLDEACLLEMVIRGQRLGQSALLHDDEAGAIHQAPFLVGAGLPELPDGCVERSVDMDDFDPARGTQVSQILDL
jgi:hypothetical protein